MHELPVAESTQVYEQHVNPQWVRLLNVLQMNVEYDRCADVELFGRDGRRILDFLSGYCVHNTGHNHPDIIAALKNELDCRGPVMLQSHVQASAGALGERLCDLAGDASGRSFSEVPAAKGWKRQSSSPACIPAGMAFFPRAAHSMV